MNNRKLKVVLLSLVLAAGMLLPANVSAQEEDQPWGGILGRGKFYGQYGIYGYNGSLFLGRGVTPIIEGEDGFTNADFGEEAPLGSGIAIMLAAGLGYVALKKKEDEQ